MKGKKIIGTILALALGAGIGTAACLIPANWDKITGGSQQEQPNNPGSTIDPDVDSDLEEGTVLPYAFDGDSITGYSGSDVEITLPTSYSLGNVVDEKIEFQEEYELMEYLMQKERKLSAEEQESLYPITIHTNSGKEVELSRRDDFMELLTTEDYPAYTIEENVQQYVVGKNFKVNKIGDYAFEKNEDIQKVVIPKGFTAVGACAFENCSNITEVVLPSTLKTIDSSAFRFCNLSNIDLPNSLETINAEAFGYNPIKTITLPNSIKVLEGSFYECRDLEKIIGFETLPLTEISDDLFHDCQNLQSVTLPKTATSIGRDAFFNCKNLTSIQLHEGITSIGQRAFYQCPFTEIDLPSTVEFIDSQVFRGTKINSIVLPKSLKKLSYFAFNYTSFLRKVYFWNYENLELDNLYATGWVFTDTADDLKLYFESPSEPTWANKYIMTIRDKDIPAEYGATLEQFNAA